MENRRPNILFAIADDASHFSAYGHNFLQTAAFDRIAKEGVLFTNSFCTNPKCSPSRASILTGLHTWQLEDASCHQAVFPNKFKVFPSLLERAGYFVGLTGKGWAPGDYIAGGFKHNPAGKSYNSITLTPPENTKISNIDYSANFVDFLSQKSADKPFCFWYGGFEPHRQYVAGEGLRAGKTTENVEVPPYLPDDEIVKEDLLDYGYETEWFDSHLAQMIAHLKEIGEYENTLIVVTSDNGAPFPRIKGQMYEQDFNLPLAISFHGKIKPNRVIDDLISFTDFAPTFLELAGVEIPEEMVGKSLIPLLESEESGYIDEERQYVLMGREHHDMGSEDDLGYPVRCIRSREYLYIRNFAPDRWPAGNPETVYPNCDGSPTKDLILEQHENGEEFYYNLSFGKRPLEELYNIIEDPCCMENLATSQPHQELKEELWQILQNELQNSGDPRIFGNGDIFETYKPDPLQFPHSWARYKNGTWEKQCY